MSTLADVLQAARAVEMAYNNLQSLQQRLTAVNAERQSLQDARTSAQTTFDNAKANLKAVAGDWV
jgi:hypothetical protein